jgi:hypothetical protein
MTIVDRLTALLTTNRQGTRSRQGDVITLFYPCTGLFRQSERYVIKPLTPFKAGSVTEMDNRACMNLICITLYSRRRRQMTRS